MAVYMEEILSVILSGFCHHRLRLFRILEYTMKETCRVALEMLSTLKHSDLRDL